MLNELQNAPALRVFLVGAGHISRCHAQTAQKMEAIFGLRAELFAAEPVEATRASFAEQFPGSKTFACVQEMLALASQKNDIAVICTPPFLHRDHALQSLGSGRHTLVEKPLAMNIEEARDIAEAARRAGRHFGDCSMRLYDMVSTRELRKRMRGGEIGTPYHVTHIYKAQRSRPGIEYQPQSRWFLDKSKAGGGILMDWGVYDLANLTSLLDPVRVEVRHAWWQRPETEVDPQDAVFDVETHAGAAMVWHLEDGARVNVSYERASGTHGQDRYFSQIEGTRGAYRWDWAWQAGAKASRFFDRQGQVQEEPLEWTNEWEAQWNLDQGDRPLITFWRHVRGEGVPALVDDATLFNFEILCALFQAAQSGQAQTVEKRCVEKPGL